MMRVKHLVSAVALAMTGILGIGCSNAQSPPEPQIYWMDSPRSATSLARKFNLPILVYITSDNCGYCRKMEQEVWTNPQIISLVEAGFVPLKLDAERDEEILATLGIRSLPTTLMFTSGAEFVYGAKGYLSASQTAGLLRRGQRDRMASQQVVVGD